MNINNYFKNQKIFFCFFPLIYLTGPLFTELFLLFVVFQNIFNLKLLKKKIVEDNRIVQLFFILIFFQSFMNFPDINYKNLLYIRFYLYYLSILILFNNDKKLEDNFNLFIKTIIYIFSFLIFFHIFQIITGSDMIDERLTIPIRQEEIAVSIYTKFYPFILILLIFVDKNYRKKDFFLKFRFIILTIALLVPVITIFSGERMNSIMLLSFILFVMIKYKPTKTIYAILLVIILFMLSKYFDIFYFHPRFEYIFERYLTFFEIINDNFILKSTWGHHFITAFNIFKENYIFGIGIKMFGSECQNYVSEFTFACTSHPHNMYLEIAAETGIISLTLFIFILFKILQVFIKSIFKKKYNIKEIIILSLSICLLIYAFPIRSTGSFFNNYNSSFFWIFFGLLLSFYEKNKKKY